MKRTTNELQPGMTVLHNGLTATVLEVSRKGNWSAVRLEFPGIGLRRSTPASVWHTWEVDVDSVSPRETREFDFLKNQWVTWNSETHRWEDVSRGTREEDDEDVATWHDGIPGGQRP